MPSYDDDEEERLGLEEDEDEEEDEATVPGIEQPPAMPSSPGPTPMSPGMAPAAGRDILGMIGRVPPPNLRPMPTRPAPEPGFRGALKDALRGAIPGYVAGQEAGLKERRTDVGLQNQQEMKLFHEQMGLIKPMLVKDYETEAWMQAVNMKRNYLMQTYPFMTQAEIAARSMGQPYRPPTPPKPGDLKNFIMPDGTRFDALMNSQGQWVDKAGVAQDPQKMAQAQEIAMQTEDKPKPYELVRGTEGAGGEPTYSRFDPKAGLIEPIPNAPKVWKDPAIQAAREQAAASRSIATEMARQRLDQSQREFASREAGRFDTALIVRKYNESVEMIHDVANRDMRNPINQESLLATFAKVNDPKTGVKETERETIRRNADTLIKKFGLDLVRTVIHQGTLSQTAVAQIQNALRDKKNSLSDQYHNFRTESARTLRLKTGDPNAQEFLIDYAKDYEERMPSPEGELRKNSQGRWVPVNSR